MAYGLTTYLPRQPPEAVVPNLCFGNTWLIRYKTTLQRPLIGEMRNDELLRATV